MDLEMPVMDGLTCIQTIRKLESGGELSPRNLVFALTGNARQGQIDAALAAGMDSVFIKPYRIDELLAKLRLAAL
jgi:CheY-like chemotaxis protein